MYKIVQISFQIQILVFFCVTYLFLKVEQFKAGLRFACFYQCFANLRKFSAELDKFGPNMKSLYDYFSRVNVANKLKKILSLLSKQCVEVF